MLRKLVDSIANIGTNNSEFNISRIIITDNDIEKSAELTVSELVDRYSGTLNISYVHCPSKGLANVRNELLKEALKTQADFIAFIDDDEYPDSEWLNELLVTSLKNNADLTTGPKIPVFESKVPKSISCWFKEHEHENDERINHIDTGNLLIRTQSLLKNNVWFDTDFNKTGGEDTYFGYEMIKKGSTIYWSKNAIVYETIPENKSKIRWLITKQYSFANIYTYIIKRDKDYLKLSRKFFVSFFYIFSGIISLVITPFPLKNRYWGLMKISSGFGGITGLLNIRYNMYR
jgi:hypothetical protein